MKMTSETKEKEREREREYDYTPNGEDGVHCSNIKPSPSSAF